MPYQDHIMAMKACIEMFDSIGYAGLGRQGLARCVAAFEAGDKGRAIEEFRHTIGDAPNFASAMTDLDTWTVLSVQSLLYGACYINTRCVPLCVLCHWLWNSLWFI